MLPVNCDKSGAMCFSGFGLTLDDSFFESAILGLSDLMSLTENVWPGKAGGLARRKAEKGSPFTSDHSEKGSEAYSIFS